MASRGSFAPVPEQATETGTTPTVVVVNAQELPLRQIRRFRDGFSSSICDLFADPFDRTSCCALTCCGTLLHDRNMYILTGEMPPSWCMRILSFIGVMLLGVFVLTIFLGPLGPVLGMVGVVIAIGIRSTLIRHTLRKRIMREMSGNSVADDGVVDGCCGQDQQVHQICSCLSKDHVFAFQRVTEEEALAYDTTRRDRRDFCTSLWEFVAYLFFGACGCWCNCWGACATAQEHRQLRLLLPKDKFMLDYVTMQPFREYYPLIEDVRRRNDNTFVGHLKARSRLAVRVVHCFEIVVGGIAILILFTSSNPGGKTLILLATMGQALLVLYLVYWRKHRFDLSLDAVIKLFGCGFLFGTGISLIVELLVQFVGSLIFGFVLFSELVEDNPDTYKADSGDPNFDVEMYQEMAERHIMTFICYTFFKAFVVAGLVEELAKYFCWWMVEHPDYLTPEEKAGLCASDNTSTHEEISYERTIHSTAAAITVGMVATATGLACSENIMYIFGQGLSLSAGTLTTRLLAKCYCKFSNLDRIRRGRDSLATFMLSHSSSRCSHSKCRYL